ncbi:MAG: hypothetical protein ABJA90_07245 [Ginsengibacter sp.]
MKSVFLFVVFFVNCMFSSFCQQSTVANNWDFIVVSATEENEITGANSEKSNRVIYNISLEAKRTFILKKILGMVGATNMEGKIIYNNTVTDSTTINNGDNFIIRFISYSGENLVENKKDSRISSDKKCRRNKKINSTNPLIFLSYFLEGKKYDVKIAYSKKNISGEKQLPQ